MNTNIEEMKEITELFSQNFMLTGDTFDPRNLDFTFYTHEKITANLDGTPALKQYYLDYDSNTNTFSNLAVDITYTYTLDNGILVKALEATNWYFEDGTIGTTREITRVFA